ncbi:MAG TPA: PAS domain S-box protein, partial [Casimicrobiaceae bacterium]
LETLNLVGRAVAAELDLERVMQIVIDAATDLTGAAVGTFLCHATTVGDGEAIGGFRMVSGPRPELVEQLPLPEHDARFRADLANGRVVRVADLADASGVPAAPAAAAAAPLRSYLALPVISRSGEIVGGLFFGHPAPGHFDERAERLAAGIASQAAAALDNARLYRAAQRQIAERARAEAALRRSDERLRLAMETGKVGVWDWDITSGQVVWTDSLYAIHGVTRDGFDGTVEGFAALVHPEDRHQVQQAIRATLEQDAPYESEFRARRADGNVVWLFAEGSLQRDESGRPVRLTGATLDVTERKKAELALRESEERFRFMADNAPVMIWLTEPDGSCSFLSRSWHEFTGIPPDVGLGDAWVATLHPDDRDWVYRNFVSHNAQRDSYEVEHVVRRADGVYRWCLTRAVPRFAPDGRYLGYLGSMIDITERKEAESALRESEARYRQVIQGLPAAIYACDAQGRIVLFNHVAVELFGHTPTLGEAMNGATYRMYAPDGRPLPESERPLARALRGETAGDGREGTEAIIERADGERRNVIAYAQVIRGTDGATVGAIKVLIDITERKAAEAELAATKDDLALQVDALTRLHDLATALTGLQEIEPALEEVLETLVAIHSADFGLLSLCDPDSRTLRPVASHGFTESQLGAVAEVEAAPGMGACGTALATRRRTVVHDATADPLFEPFADFARRAGFRTVHSTPILTRGGEALGVVSVFFRAIREPSALERHIADMCARYAAETIELIRSQQSLREADRRKDEFLATLAHELRNPLAPIRNAMHVIRMSGDDREAV